MRDGGGEWWIRGVGRSEEEARGVRGGGGSVGVRGVGQRGVRGAWVSLKRERVEWDTHSLRDVLSRCAKK